MTHRAGSAPNRIVVVSGPWQAISAAAAMKAVPPMSTVVVFAARTSSAEIRRATEMLSPLVPGFERFLDLQDSFSLRHLGRLRRFSKVLAHFRDAIKLESVAEVWVSSPENWPEHFIWQAFGEADLNLYEDGAGVYFSERSSGSAKTLPKQGTLLFSRLRKLAQLRGVGIAREMTASAKRMPGDISKAFLFLPDIMGRTPALPRATIQDVPVNAVRTVIQEARDLLGITDFWEFPTDAGIFLGQNSAESGLMSWQLECDLYVQGMERMFDGKTEVIFWREHPKAVHVFYPALRDRLGSRLHRFPKRDQHLPLELFIREGVPLNVAGVTSSSLLYLRKLWNIPTWQCADLFAPMLPGRYGAMCETFAKILPSSPGKFPERTVTE